MITASALTRLRQCPSSAVLPRAENASVWADAGNDEHEQLARWTTTRDESHLPESIASELVERLDTLVPVGSRAEVKLAYDVVLRTARIIGEGGGRDYGQPGPFEIVGSTDIVFDDGATLVIADWKTGYADVEPAATNDQLWFYALAACRAIGRTQAIVRIIYTKTGFVDSYEIDALELAEFANKLEQLHMRVAARQRQRTDGEILETREGSWCKHCASKPYCGSKTALLVQVATGGLAVVGDTALTPERAALAYEQVRRMRQLVDEAEKRMDTWVEDNGPIVLGNGRAYGKYAKKANESLDGKLAVQAIREVIGESAKEFEAEAVEVKVTKAGIKRAAQRFSPSAIGKTEKAVLARVKALNGIKGGGMYYPIGEVAVDKVLDRAPEIDTAALNRALAEVG